MKLRDEKQKPRHAAKRKGAPAAIFFVLLAVISGVPGSIKSPILYRAFSYSSSIFSMATNASCGMFKLPIDFIRFLPSFCFSNNLRLRVMSPP